jgi:hypothetical protein
VCPKGENPLVSIGWKGEEGHHKGRESPSTLAGQEGEESPSSSTSFPFPSGKRGHHLHLDLGGPSCLPPLGLLKTVDI